MADLDIAIAGRNYRVACEDGQESNLAHAAQLVAEEADVLREQFGAQFAGLSESRVLLMASLMLGDRFRAHLSVGGEAAEAPIAEPVAEPMPDAPQAGLFEDPAAGERISTLEAELAAAREAEAQALAALEDAAARVRAMAVEMSETAGEEPAEEVDDEADDEADEDAGEADPEEDEAKA